jgi:methionine-rich copper-binding protein CopC
VRRTFVARAVAIAGVSTFLVLLFATTAFAHAALTSSDPAANTTVAVVTAITGTFSEKLDASKSTIELRNAAGSTVGTGGVPASDTNATTMRIDLATALPAGVYEVRWTSVTPDDQGVERGTFGFTVGTGATAAPAATPTPAASGSSGDGSGGTDVFFPVVAAVVAVVVVGGALMITRRRQS